MAKSFDPPQSSLNKARVHRYSRCWRITRPDGTNFDFTDHPNSLKVRTGETAVGSALEGVSPSYVTFNPSDGLDASAAEFSDGLVSNDFEVQGIVSSGKITEEDLRGGRFDNSEVTEYLVDWRYPWNGYFEKNTYLVLNLAFSNRGWRADLVSKVKSQEKKVGMHWTRNCRHILGDSGCGVNLGTNNQAGNAITTGTLSISAVAADKRSWFKVSSLSSGYANNDFNYGFVEFKNGSSKLANLKLEILDYIASTRQVKLCLPTPFDMNDGLTDTVVLVQGCDKRSTTCTNKYNNFVKYGGFPYIPGDDKVRVVPDAPE